MTPGGDDGKRGGRQDQVQKEVLEGAAAIDGIHARGGKQAPMDGKEVDEEEAQPERRHGDAGQHKEGDDAVGPAELPHR